MLSSRFLMLFVIFTLFHPPLAGAQSAIELYQHGHHEEAKTAFADNLARARIVKDSRTLWSALMGSAWYADETGDHKNAITYSNEALEVASKVNDPFMIGRSLCWLGWAYSSMGRYQTAIEFYSHAMEIGAPDGKIEILPVWGLASQELGAIYFKMGDTEKAEQILTHTVQVAREANVLAGVAEGSAHLAEIALIRGGHDEALRFATEAVSAAVSCNCSPFNEARARVVRAKVALKLSERKLLKPPQALEWIEEALQYSEKMGTKTCLAEAKILKSKTLPAHDFKARYELLTDALVLLLDSESELRGTAESGVGEFFLDQNKQEYADLYLRQGIKINEEMLRQVDNAYIITSIAELEGLKGDQRKSLEELKRATDLALSAGQWPLAAANSEKLADSFRKLGYDRMAIDWYKSCLEVIDKLIEKEKQRKPRESLERKKVLLMQQYSEISLKFASVSEANAT